jgi:hypothetical protein
MAAEAAMSDRDFVPVLPNGENGDESEWLKIRSFIPYPPFPIAMEKGRARLHEMRLCGGNGGRGSNVRQGFCASSAKWRKWRRKRMAKNSLIYPLSPQPSFPIAMEKGGARLAHEKRLCGGKGGRGSNGTVGKIAFCAIWVIGDGGGAVCRC